MANVFEFDDYRNYLKECFKKIKQRNPHFSYEAFSKRLGFNNKGFIYRIINECLKRGKKNIKRLPLNRCEKISAALKHTPAEAEYFENLVAMAQARNEKEKTYYYKKSRYFISETKMCLLRKDQCEYYSKWYYSAIFSLIEIFPIKDNFAEAGAMLTPPITTAEAKKSIELLERLGLIKLGEDGFYHHTKEKKLKTGVDMPQEVKNKAHIKYTELAKKSIINEPPHTRHAVSMTLGISRGT